MIRYVEFFRNIGYSRVITRDKGVNSLLNANLDNYI